MTEKTAPKVMHTPGDWDWQSFGELMLVGQHGMRPIVLQAHGNQLRVRNPVTGLMVPLTPDHPDARLLKAAPDLLTACEDALLLGVPTGAAYGNDEVSHDEIRNRLCAAIASAKGDTS